MHIVGDVLMRNFGVVGFISSLSIFLPIYSFLLVLFLALCIYIFYFICNTFDIMNYVPKHSNVTYDGKLMPFFLLRLRICSVSVFYHRSDPY